jgi:uncharacterized membrane protein
MDRTNRIIWTVIGIVLFLASYVLAMSLFHS